MCGNWQYCYDCACHSNIKPDDCTVSDTARIVGKSCKCASSSTTAECLPNKFCYDDGCQDVAKPLTPCMQDDSTAITSACQCVSTSTANECVATKFCYGNACHAAKKVILVGCNDDGINAIAQDCHCSATATTNECVATKFCYDGVCHDAKKPPSACVESDDGVVNQLCQCGAGVLCSPGSYCWVGSFCETDVKPPSPVVECVPSDNVGVQGTACKCALVATDNECSVSFKKKW